MNESTAICLYLATRYGPSPLVLSSDQADYPHFLNWLFFSDATLTFPQTIVLRHRQFEVPGNPLRTDAEKGDSKNHFPTRPQPAYPRRMPRPLRTPRPRFAVSVSVPVRARRVAAGACLAGGRRGVGAGAEGAMASANIGTIRRSRSAWPVSFGPVSFGPILSRSRRPRHNGGTMRTRKEISWRNSHHG
jgi:hypothetical protein